MDAAAVDRLQLVVDGRFLAHGHMEQGVVRVRNTDDVDLELVFACPERACLRFRARGAAPSSSKHAQWVALTLPARATLTLPFFLHLDRADRVAAQAVRYITVNGVHRVAEGRSRFR
jgi:hypothetical protein